MLIWSAIDPWFEILIDRIKLGLAMQSMTSAVQGALAYVGWWRPTLLLVILTIGASHLAWRLFNLFWRSCGKTRSRSVRGMMVWTLFVALWLSFLLHLPAITWQAKRARLLGQVDELERIAAPLRSQWPSQDGELPYVGPFMAYPIGNPTTLILLNPQAVGPHSLFISSLFISAIERDSSGAVRLQLSGARPGDWAEWHPENSQPESFVGGLQDRHELRSALSLGSGWYLVRYHA